MTQDVCKSPFYPAVPIPGAFFSLLYLCLSPTMSLDSLLICPTKEAQEDGHLESYSALLDLPRG